MTYPLFSLYTFSFPVFGERNDKKKLKHTSVILYQCKHIHDLTESMIKVDSALHNKMIHSTHIAFTQNSVLLKRN